MPPFSSAPSERPAWASRGAPRSTAARARPVATPSSDDRRIRVSFRSRIRTKVPRRRRPDLTGRPKAATRRRFVIPHARRTEPRGARASPVANGDDLQLDLPRGPAHGDDLARLATEQRAPQGRSPAYLVHLAV